jgi:hypothetical protein
MKLPRYELIAEKSLMVFDWPKEMIIRIDDSLEKYKTMPIFQDKVDKANEMLRTIGLPKLSMK